MFPCCREPALDLRKGRAVARIVCQAQTTRGHCRRSNDLRREPAAGDIPEGRIQTTAEVIVDAGQATTPCLSDNEPPNPLIMGSVRDEEPLADGVTVAHAPLLRAPGRWPESPRHLRQRPSTVDPGRAILKVIAIAVEVRACARGQCPVAVDAPSGADTGDAGRRIRVVASVGPPGRVRQEVRSCHGG